MLRRINEDDDDDDEDDDDDDDGEDDDDDDGDDDDDDDGDDDEGGRRMIMICPEPRTTLCVAVEMHFNMSQEPLCTENVAPQNEPRVQTHTLCEPAQSNPRQHFTKGATLYGFLNTKNAAPQNRGADFMRACAVETRVKISQSHFIRKFTGKMPAPRVSTLIKHRPLRLP